MSGASDNLVPVQVKGLMLDPASNVPIVILREENGTEFLPIWIGVFEANAIALKLEGIEAARPMTHDLMAQLVGEMQVQVRRIVVCDLEESTFFARIDLLAADQEISIDSRPSDAIALALRLEAPIYVAQEVFDKARTSDLSTRLNDEEKLKKWLEEVDPDDLGKYTM